MNKKLAELRRTRAKLLTRINVQREQMSEIGKQLRFPLELANQGVAAARFLRRYPLLFSGVAALFVLRRRGMTGLLVGIWRVWKGYRYFNVLSAKLSSKN